MRILIGHLGSDQPPNDTSSPEPPLGFTSHANSRRTDGDLTEVPLPMPAVAGTRISPENSNSTEAQSNDEGISDKAKGKRPELSDPYGLISHRDFFPTDIILDFMAHPMKQSFLEMINSMRYPVFDEGTPLDEQNRVLCLYYILHVMHEYAILVSYVFGSTSGVGHNIYPSEWAQFEASRTLRVSRPNPRLELLDGSCDLEVAQRFSCDDMRYNRTAHVHALRDGHEPQSNSPNTRPSMAHPVASQESVPDIPSAMSILEGTEFDEDPAERTEVDIEGDLDKDIELQRILLDAFEAAKR